MRQGHSVSTGEQEGNALSNDWRFSCKRLARPALTYVPPSASGGWRTPELSSDAHVGCMRWLGGSAVPQHRQM